MKRFKNAVFSVMNVLVIAGILIFIAVGLMKIGIFEVPGFLGNLFGESQEQPDVHHDPAVDFISETDSATEYAYHSVSLNSESVKNLLSEITPKVKYSHDLQYTVFSDKNSMSKRVFVMKNQDMYCAFYLSGDGAIEKQIFRNSEHTGINNLSENGLKSTVYNNGDVDFAAQTGVILTHEDFFSAADDPAYSFSLGTGDVGTVMKIDFTSVNGAYSQQQKYTLSLDYGIVVEAKCYENGVLIYELYTNSVSEDIIPAFAVPEEYVAYMPLE